VFVRMNGLAGIVFLETAFGIRCRTDIESLWIGFALKGLDIMHERVRLRRSYGVTFAFAGLFIPPKLRRSDDRPET